MRTTFGDWTLDTDARQLWSAAGPVPLSPKAFDLLARLVENCPRAMSKDELHESLWPGVYVSETNLAGLVGEIRRAIHDDARVPRFVRTVQRFGYAFSGTLRPGSAPSTELERPHAGWLTHGTGRIPLVQGENILGRALDIGGRDVITISRRHARIVIDGTVASVEDLGSKNGTFVRGRRIRTAVRLADGDSLELGSVPFVFRARVADDATRTAARRNAARRKRRS